MYDIKTGGVLTFLGYTENDFTFSRIGNDNRLDWHHADPKPTEQVILDNLLPWAKDRAYKQIKKAAATKRCQYVTDAAGKDAEYTYKDQEAAQFTADSTVGIFMQARMDVTGETAQAVADEWSSNAVAWRQVGAYLAAIEDHGSQQIEAAQTAEGCETIAANIIAMIEAI